MIQSRWSMMLGIVPLTLALAGLAGCGNQGTGPETAESAAAELNAPPGRGSKTWARRGGHGPAFLLGAALKKLDLTDAQRATIEGELAALRAPDEDLEDARAEHREALAAAVRSGTIDEAALLAKMKDGAPKPDTARLAKAVQTLHDTLTATQRTELVAAVNEKMAKRAGPWGGPDGKAARGEKGDRGKWGKRGEKGARGHGMRGHAKHGPMGHLLAGIELSDAQREKMREAFEKMAPSEADREAMKARHEAFRKAMKERLDTFASDSFDANAFVALPGGGPEHGPAGKAGHMVKTLSVVVPLLDATQRAELAKRIEEGPSHR